MLARSVRVGTECTTYVLVSLSKELVLVRVGTECTTYVFGVKIDWFSPEGSVVEREWS